MAEGQYEIETKAADNESIDYIDNEEELKKLLEGSESPDPDKPQDEDEEDEVTKFFKESDKDQEDKDDKDKDKNGIEIGAKAKDEKEKETDTATKEYSNIIHYLNDKFDLKMNIDALGEEIDREKEAQIVEELYNRVVTNANAKLSEYQRIDKVLQDPEVTNFIKAKSEGKTFNDFIKEYSGDTAGKDNETIVKDKVKRDYPGMSEDEIQNVIEGYKDKNILDKMADAERKAIIDRETEKRKNEEAKKAKSEEDAQKEREEDVAKFTSYVSKVNKVYGIPISNEMKSQIIYAATQPDDDGYTYIDKALQSDEGVVRAALGLIHLEHLIRANNTLSKNRSANSLVDKLLSDPSELQSGSSVKEQEGFNPEIANSF